MEGVGRVDVVVHPHAPAVPIQGFHQRQVLLDSAPVLLLLVLGRVGGTVEGESNNLLVASPSPRVLGAGAVQQLWLSFQVESWK